MVEIKDDIYAHTRGESIILRLVCTECGNHITDYQKDGPGPLKRMYVDRIHDEEAVRAYEIDKKLCCSQCGLMLGLGYRYEKEDRPAYRMFEYAVEPMENSRFYTK